MTYGHHESEKKVMRFIEPLTDFGFKKLFADPQNVEILIDLLNTILHNEGTDCIEDIDYLSTEHLGDGEEDRKAFFDLYCRSKAGDYFIVEMQRSYQPNYVSRSLFYASYALRDQNVKGVWDFNLSAVIVINLLGFKLNETPGKLPIVPGKYLYSYRLTEEDNPNDYISLERLIFVELGAVTKQAHELTTRLEKWLYILNHVSSWLERPQSYHGDHVFEQFLTNAEIAKYNREERYAYEKSLKVFRDEYAVGQGQFDLGLREGRQAGIEEGRQAGIEEGRQVGRREQAARMVAHLRSMKKDDEEICQLLAIECIDDIEKL